MSKDKKLKEIAGELDNASKMHFSSIATPGKNVRILRVYQKGKGKKPRSRRDFRK